MISFSLTTEQQLIQETIASYLRENAPTERLLIDGHDAPEEKKIETRLAELGVFGLGLAETSGGLGLDSVEEAVIHRELGRRLISPRSIATALAAYLAADAGDTALLDEILAGKTRAAFAIPVESAQNEDGEVHIMDRTFADVLVFLAPNLVGLVDIDAFEDTTPVQSIDDAIRLGRGRLTRPPAYPDPARQDRLLRKAQLFIASQAVGLAEAARDLAVDYAKVREQFGRPIGVFQAVAHQCADMAVRARAAHAQTAFATLSDRNEQPDRVFHALSAVVVAIDAVLQNSAACIQVHGGFGYTAGCHAHRYLKRGLVLERLAGGLPQLRRRILSQPSFL